jgi:hypothetical protein
MLYHNIILTEECQVRSRRFIAYCCPEIGDKSPDLRGDPYLAGRCNIRGNLPRVLVSPQVWLDPSEQRDRLNGIDPAPPLLALHNLSHICYILMLY